MHANATRDSHGSSVAGFDDGEDPFESKIQKPVLQNDSSGFAGVALAPDAPSQMPTNFNLIRGGRELLQQHCADHLLSVALNHCPGTESLVLRIAIVRDSVGEPLLLRWQVRNRFAIA